MPFKIIHPTDKPVLAPPTELELMTYHHNVLVAGLIELDKSMAKEWKLGLRPSTEFMTVFDYLVGTAKLFRKSQEKIEETADG